MVEKMKGGEVETSEKAENHGTQRQLPAVFYWGPGCAHSWR